MSRSALGSIALLVGTLLGCLILSEFIVRLYFPTTTRSYIVRKLDDWSRPDPQFHHVGDGIFHLNFPSPTDPASNRVMIVGDSFAAGHGVGEENRFGHLLQAELGDRAKVDVLATSSYSPVIYRNLIRKAFSLAAYRAVAVFIDQTDPADDMIYELDVIKDRSQSFDLERMNDRRQVFEKARADFVEHFSGPLNPRRFAVFNLLFPLSIKDFFDPRGKYYREAKLSFGRLALIAEFNAHPESDNSKTMLSLISGHLDQIVAMSQERRVHLFLIANPWEYQSSKSPRTSLQQPAPFPKRNRLEEILTAKYGHLAGVTVVPLTRFFREQPDPSSLFISHPADETHWNQKGHVLVAAVLRQYLGNSLPDLFPGRNLN